MEHPIFRNKTFLYVYLAGWGLVAVIHFAFLYTSELHNLEQSIVDSLIWNALLALLGLASWTPVRYNLNISGAVFNVIVTHITTLIIILLIWIGVGCSIMKLIYDSLEYNEFLTSSIPWRLITASLFYLILALIYYLLIYYQNVEEKLRNENKLKEIVREGELNLLKSQINPHFLFNCLNSVSSLTMTNPSAAQEMIIKLSDFLRYGVSKSNQQFTELSQELENIKRYLDIEKVRFGSKLQYDFNIQPSCLSFQLPVMILQPVFENAVKHGVYESIEPVCIHTNAKVEGGKLIIEVINDFDPEAIPAKGTGTGLQNIRQRLKIIYGSEELLKAVKKENMFYVIMVIPFLSLIDD
jgi:LytS/YehU family sensor histidine kinase